MKLLPVFGRHLEFQDEGIIGEGWHGARRKLTLENTGITFGIFIYLAQNLRYTVHLQGVIYPPPTSQL